MDRVPEKREPQVRHGLQLCETVAASPTSAGPSAMASEADMSDEEKIVVLFKKYEDLKSDEARIVERLKEAWGQGPHRFRSR